MKGIAHDVERRERFGPPIDGNERKEAVFDLVPLARRRGIMRHGDRELFFSGQGLQGLLPQLVAHTIAAAPIGGDEQFLRLRIQPFAAVLPPPPDTLHRKFRRLMIDTHVHEALVVHQVIDAIRDGFATGERAVVVDVHPRLLPFGLPCSCNKSASAVLLMRCPCRESALTSCVSECVVHLIRLIGSPLGSNNASRSPCKLGSVTAAFFLPPPAWRILPCALTRSPVSSLTPRWTVFQSAPARAAT